VMGYKQPFALKILQKYRRNFYLSKYHYWFDLIWFIVFNATFSNISAILWRPVLMVEETGVPGENHRPWASNW
jgi:hypothetical protein